MSNKQLARRVLLTIFAGFSCAFFVPADDEFVPRHVDIPTFKTLSQGPWRYVPVQEKQFWFSLGGGENSEVHRKSVEQGKIADIGPIGTGVGEWEYSFHHIKPGEADGAGYIHHGGYPTPPATRAEAAAVVRAYYEKLVADARAKATPEEQKLFESFNGHHCYQHYACEWGCDVVGSEVGENINSTQAHIAFTRGAARQYGKPWLIDFSSWYGPSMYDEDPRKTWGDNSGPDHGHSVSLHLRTYYAAYVAGANVVVAEAGWLNFFKSQEPGSDGTLPLSRLGEAGRNFYAFTQRHPDRGVPYTPIALLFDYYHGIYPGFGKKLAWNHFPYTQGDQRILDLLDLFFPASLEVLGKKDERGYHVATPFGDIVDVLLTNAPDEVLQSYPVLMLAGEWTDLPALMPKLDAYTKRGGILVIAEADALLPASAATFKLGSIETNGLSVQKHGRGKVVVYAEQGDGDERPVASVVESLRAALVPFHVAGTVESLFNRTRDGWLVTCINNEGIVKAPREAPTIDPSGAQSVTLRYTGRGKPRKATVLGITSDDILDPRHMQVTIPPGEVRVIRIGL